MDETTMSSSEVCEFVGISYRQLDHWCRTGLLGERLQSPGSGSPNYRYFLDEDLAKVETIARLRDCGVNFSVIRRLAKNDQLPDFHASGSCVVLSDPPISIPVSRLPEVIGNKTVQVLRL